MITREELKELELAAPRYEFVEAGEGNEETLPPVKRQIAKIQEAALTFTPYEVFQHIAMLKKQIQGHKDSITGLETKLELYEAELELIEKSLGVSELNRQFQAEEAKTVAALAEKVEETK